MVYCLDDVDVVGPEPAASQKALDDPGRRRVCLRCGRSALVPSDDAESRVCDGCGSRFTARKSSVEKGWKAQEVEWLVAMATSGNSEVARRGMDGLIQRVGLLCAADLVINSNR